MQSKLYRIFTYGTRDGFSRAVDLSTQRNLMLRYLNCSRHTLYSVMQDLKTHTCASELSLEQPLQIARVHVLQSNFQTLLLELQTCGLCNGTTFREVPANKGIRTKNNGISESAKYMLEEGKDATHYHNDRESRRPSTCSAGYGDI